MLVIGLGLALLPIHNQWLTSLATNSKGETLFFLPAFGYLLLIMGAGLFLVNNWDKVQQMGWGDKKVVIPLIIISGLIGLSGLTAEGWQDKVAPLGMGLALFATYLVARVLGRGIFFAFAPFVIVGVVSIVVGGLLSAGEPTGGFITNYCASGGYIIIGILLVLPRSLPRWPFIMVALVGLFFVGALEVVFIISMLGIVVLVRRDFGRSLYILTGCVVVVIVVWWLLGYLTPLYMGNSNIQYLWMAISGQSAIDSELLEGMTSGRWGVYMTALADIRLLGHGLFLGVVEGGTVHNVPLIIMHQVGPIVAVMWLFVSAYCLIKTQWKYAWVAVIAMGVFDHYLWTQFTPLWWALVGVSTNTTIQSDLIFRG